MSLKTLKQWFGRTEVPPTPETVAATTPTNAATPALVPKNGPLAEAWAEWDADKQVDALRRVEKIIRNGATHPHQFYLLGLCLERIGRHEEARRAFQAELKRDPSHAQAAEWFERLTKALARPVRRRIPTAERDYHSSLPHGTLMSIQGALHNYSYRGVPMLKNPFDMALYPMLLWKIRPRTIIEIGSKSGGSGLWFGDQLENFGIDGHIYSIDVVKVTEAAHPRVTFMEGNGRELGTILTPEFLAKLPRPWLVIEDADHAYETSSAALKFFDPLLQPGEYIVVEDGIISDIAQDPQANSGPHRAIKEFIAARGADYEMDGTYCDFFGYNMTWCTNGFLRKKGGLASLEEVRLMIQENSLDDAFEQLNARKALRKPERDVDLLRARYFLKVDQVAGAVEALKEELRFFPDNLAASDLLKELQTVAVVSSGLGSPEFREWLEVIRPFTMVGEERLWSLYQRAREVCEKDLPGNFVECGVAAGGSSALLARVIQKYSRRPRQLFCFDSFEGMPKASEQDVHRGVQAEQTGWGSGTCAAPETSLREICDRMKVSDLVVPVKGLFENTLPKTRERIGPIAFLHLDGDWYSSTCDILHNLFDQVVPGAALQIDDYGFWDGCRQAVQEFQRERNLEFKLQQIDYTGVWFVK